MPPGAPADGAVEEVERRMRCAVCLILNAADGLAFDCDAFDGAQGGSCP
jgi:hypothetical protein